MKADTLRNLSLAAILLASASAAHAQGGAAAAQKAGAQEGDAKRSVQKFSQGGVEVELSIEPAAQDSAQEKSCREAFETASLHGDGKSEVATPLRLRASEAGTYAAEASLPRRRAYDLLFKLDSPAVTHCFEVKPPERPVMLRVEYLTQERALRAGQDFVVRFRLEHVETKRPVAGLSGARVLFFLSPGVWQKRDFARHTGEGVYEITVKPPQSGVYMLFVESASQGVRFRDLPHMTLQVTADPPAQGNAESNK